MLNIIKKTKIKSEGRQPFLTEGGVWLMCLHLTLPSSSAATVGYPKQEGRTNYEAQRAWKNCTENIQHQKSRNFKFLKTPEFW